MVVSISLALIIFFMPLKIEAEELLLNQDVKYSLHAFIDHSSVNPTDRVTVELFIHGSASTIELDHKLIIHVPENLVKGNVEVISFSLASQDDKSAIARCPPTINHMRYRFTMNLNKYFLHYLKIHHLRD